MWINRLGKITQIAVPGAIFASVNKEAYIEISNYQQVTFLIESGEGTAGNTTITLEAKAGSGGTAAAVPFMYMEKDGSEFEIKESAVFSVGGAAGASKYAVVTVTSPMMAKGEYDRVAVKTTAISSSTVIGAITAIQTQPRYTEEG